MIQVQACPEDEEKNKKFILQMSHTSRWNRPNTEQKQTSSIRLPILESSSICLDKPKMLYHDFE